MTEHLCAAMQEDGSACGKPARIYTASSGKAFTLCEEHYDWFVSFGAGWAPTPEEMTGE